MAAAAASPPAQGSHAAPYVTAAYISGVEKRRLPSPHYAYVMRFTWSSGKKTLALRSHLELFRFQCALLDMFPEESGEGGGIRTIPRLPGTCVR